MFISSFCSKSLFSFPSLLVPCIFFFISLCIVFSSSSILPLYSIISVNILIFSVLNCASDRLLISLSLLEFWSVLSFGPYIFLILPHLLYYTGWSPRGSNPHCHDVALYVGEGSERVQCHVLSWLSVTSPHPQTNWALLMLIPGWVGLCMF